MATTITYTGAALAAPQHGLDAYIPSDALKNAVNLMLYLKKRPLLLMGEAGCGKTRLAEAVAYELHGEKFKEHFFKWYIKSTSKAQEGIYQMDYLQRLHDANAKQMKPIGEYIEHGAMYDAFIKPNRKDENGNTIPNILLIDEIDKADIDFPNDLLLELDKREFLIRELSQTTIPAESEVIIFITSNEEKELPPAFLRRCLFHYIDFPNKKDLATIIYAKFNNEKENETVNTAISIFEKLRESMDNYHKKPSTSELLEWFDMISYVQALEKSQQVLSKEQQALVTELSELGTEKIPFKQILLKNKASFINPPAINLQDDDKT